MDAVENAQFAGTWPPEDGGAETCPSCGGLGEDEHEIRCVDCFGSGVAGDGQVSVLATRELATLTDCPRCAAPALQACRHQRGGTARKQFHQERHRRAVAQLLRGVIDRPDMRRRAARY